jgi:hypothetical protein
MKPRWARFPWPASRASHPPPLFSAILKCGLKARIIGDPFEEVDREARRPPPLPSGKTSVRLASTSRDVREPNEDDRREAPASPNRQIVQTYGREGGKPLASSQRPYLGASDGRGWSELPVAPWRRYFARMLDTSLNGLVGLTLLAVGFYAFAPVSAESFFGSFSGPANRAVDGFLSTLIARFPSTRS